MRPSLVVSLGGNAILPAENAGTIDEQFEMTKETMRSVVELIPDHRVIITHGNGPIVGNILLRNEAASDQVPPMPLDICGADSQGGIGYMIQQILQNLFRERGVDQEVGTLVTQVVVDKGDAGFRNPTKPIGPFYPEQKARELERKKGWKVALDSGRGWRRVVPSPVPLRIVELPMIRTLYESGSVVIVAGGGGIPVVENPDGSLSGVEAVIDKDLVSVVLALALGIETLLVVTAVERVALDYGKPTQRWCDRLTLAEAMRHLADGQFPPGSMGPKMEAAVWFLKAGGRAVCITSAEQIRPALQKRAGTWMTA